MIEQAKFTNIDRLKEVQQLQIYIKLNKVQYTARRGQYYCIAKQLLPIVLIKDKLQRNLSLEDADAEQSKLINKLYDMNRGKTPIGEKPFSK